jgi:hypothetical protein
MVIQFSLTLGYRKIECLPNSLRKNKILTPKLNKIKWPPNSIGKIKISFLGEGKYN